VMSRPYTFPLGPTRFADSRTSIPPPDPRSSTVWPGSSSISAVGLPQPSEAATASGGNPCVSSVEYKFDVIGSPQPQDDGPVADDSVTAAAIAPYFSRTTCWISDTSISHICKCECRDLRQVVLYLSRRIYEQASDGHGVAVQGAGRRHSAADS